MRGEVEIAVARRIERLPVSHRRLLVQQQIGAGGRNNS